MILLQLADQWGRAISLTEAQWKRHLLPRHPEMAPFLDAIGATVAAAERVTFDATHPHRECFYRANVLPPPFDHLWLKVVVEFAASGGDPSIGTIVTAYALPALKAGEQPKWP